MTDSRGATAAAWWPWLVLPSTATALVTVGLTLGLSTAGDSWVTGDAWVNVPLAIGFSTVAAGIWATRPHPPGLVRLGVLYTVSGLAAACTLPAYGLARTDVAGAVAFAWISNWVWALGAAPLLGLGLLLYPDGRLPGRRWWPVAVLGVAGPVALTLSGMLTPGPLDNHPRFDNPVGFASPELWRAVGGAGSLVLLAAGCLGVAALVVTYRRAARHSDVRAQVRGLVVAGTVAVAIAAVPASDSALVTLAGVVAVSALPATIGVAVVRHRLLDQRGGMAVLEREVGSLAESRRRIVDEREEERARLRRELHDGIGPSLAAIGLGLRHLQRSGPPEEDSVKVLADEVQRAVGEVRRICDGLRPAALDELGLAAALEESLEPLRRFGPTIEVVLGSLPPLPASVEVAAYRIVMEATTNAVRHAQARLIRICIDHDEALVVRISDDGTGLAPAGRGGHGMRAMAERASEVGGRLAVCPRASGGATVTAWLPGVTRD